MIALSRAFDAEPLEVTHAFNHAKLSLIAIRLGHEPPKIPADFTAEQVRLVRVALWAYAIRSGTVGAAAVPHDLREHLASVHREALRAPV